MLMAPISCRTSSAAIVSARMRDSAKAEIFGNRRAQVMADHEHVEMLVERVDGEGHGGVGGGGQAIGLAADLNNVRGVAAARAFGVVGVNGAAFEGGDGILHEAGFVQRVGVDGDLHVVFFGDGERAVDGGGSGAPVFVKLEADGAGFDLFARAARGERSFPCRESRDSSGNASADSSMRCMFHAPGVQVVASVPVAGPVPPPISVVRPPERAVVTNCGQIK